MNAQQHTKEESSMFIHEIEDEQDAINFCIQGVENNNDMNGAWWSDWDDADFLIAV
jgi:hypothetical protein